MRKPANAMFVALALAGFAAASGEAGAQTKAAKAGKDAPHLADGRPRGTAAEERAATLRRIKLEQDAMKEELERRKAEQEAAEAAKRKKAQEAEARRLAALAQEKEALRMRKAKEARCVIKPVMTDADIENCRDVAR